MRRFLIHACLQCGVMRGLNDKRPTHLGDCTGTIREIWVVPETRLAGAVDALLAAPMPEVESTLKGEEWAERYGEWWHEHVRPHIVGGQ